MADLTATNVVVVRAWNEGGVAGKDRIRKIVQLTLTAMGSAANKIPASALGLTKIESVSPLVKSDGSVIHPASPSYDGANILVNGINAGNITAAPADLTGTFQAEVAGY